eukprot:2969286-Alexandrium_andersonii.AAC.1
MAQQDELALMQAKLAGLERKLAGQQTPRSRANSAGFSTPPTPTWNPAPKRSRRTPPGHVSE